MKRSGILLFLTVLTLLAVSACGLTRRSPHVRPSEPEVFLPLTDSADIARSRERAQAVMDSLDRLQTGVRPPSGDGIHTESGVIPLPEAPKDLADQLLDYARTFLGKPYRLGASGPDRYDCSGFTLTVFREFGIELPHNSLAQFRMCRPVESFADLRKGDLVFFGSRSNIREIGHVGIVEEVDLERGMFRFIHASTTNGVEIQRSTQPYFMMRYMGAGRILPD